MRVQGRATVVPVPGWMQRVAFEGQVDVGQVVGIIGEKVPVEAYPEQDVGIVRVQLNRLCQMILRLDEFARHQV